jgi:hypothetical protein
LLALGAPGLALAQYYEYLATGEIQTVQAVDANYDPIPGFDYTKINNAGVVAGAAASGSAVIDSNTPPTPQDPPNAAVGQYDGAYPVISAGTFTVAGMLINNAILVRDNHPATPEVPAEHDAFGYGGTLPRSTTGPSFLQMDNGTPEDRKGSAVILVSWLGVQLVSSTALPTSINLANANLAATMVLDVIDTDVNQRYTVTSSIDSLTIDLDADPPPVLRLPTMNGWMLGMLGSFMLLVGAVFVRKARRLEA